MSSTTKLWVVLGAIAVGLAIPSWTDAVGLVREMSSAAWFVEAAARSGPWLVVLVLALAIVASALASRPIAMAAGALYGKLYGGLLVVAGAVVGAVFAFGLSRSIGNPALSTSSRSAAVWTTRPRSQAMLMMLVFASRLVPFVSFDAVSYAAGLTSLRPWRFLLATTLGVIPVGFAFAAMGAGVVAREAGRGPGLRCDLDPHRPMALSRSRNPG